MRRTCVRALYAILVAAVAALISSAHGGAATGDVLSFTATERTLPNGLKVIVLPTGFPNLVTVRVVVQTGSRNEIEQGKSGFAHLFEHLMLRGTTTKSPDNKYQEIMVKAGARANGSTGDDSTTYHATFAKAHLEAVVAVYADMFQRLAYAESEFKTEAGAVLGEYNSSADPLDKLVEVQRNHYYQRHTYKHTTIGFIADIENMPNQYEYSKVFFQRWYRPQSRRSLLLATLYRSRCCGYSKSTGAVGPPTVQRRLRSPRNPNPAVPCIRMSPGRGRRCHM